MANPEMCCNARSHAHSSSNCKQADQKQLAVTPTGSPDATSACLLACQQLHPHLAFDLVGTISMYPHQVGRTCICSFCLGVASVPTESTPVTRWPSKTTIYSFELPRLACFCSSDSVHGGMAKPAGGAVAVACLLWIRRSSLETTGLDRCLAVACWKVL